MQLGGLIAVLSGRDPYDFILDGLLMMDSYGEKATNEITDKGDEKDRLIPQGLCLRKIIIKPDFFVCCVDI